ncbi:uracil phosphoribosyltransferase [Algoriphagus sp.]|uniref:uracil phosphoribosyltransferase n=1 Tax=Algoriphagus sp. TaxID=1872435 RepID=UPI0026337B41|nr:uracil phosphoribosyltransferase [Algoriphagus sp.]
MFILDQTPSIANQFIAEMRDETVQKDRMRFRTNLTRLGEILAYEISKSLTIDTRIVRTPLGKINIQIPSDQLVIVSVLRASLPFYQGFINFYDQAESGFIGAYREEKSTPADNEDIHINLNYLACPSIEDKTVIIADPMLATGKSFLKAIQKLLGHGRPKIIHIAAAFAAPEGIDQIKNNLEIPYRFWLGALDEGLNELSYIVPGLGDAGDLAFGPKL